MDKISNAKSEFRLKQWTQIIRTCQESELKVATWCEQNNVNIKSYYYWLRKIRSIACESTSLLPLENSQQIVPLSLGHPKSAAAVTIHLSSISVDIHNGASKETIGSVLAVLKSIC